MNFWTQMLIIFLCILGIFVVSFFSLWLFISVGKMNNKNPSHKRSKFYFNNQQTTNEIIKIAKKSDDVQTQVGCKVVDQNNKTLSVGYNHFFCKDLPQSTKTQRIKKPIHLSKYPYIIHAEEMAIWNLSLEQQKVAYAIFVSLFPCPQCAKLIAQTGIKNVYFLSFPSELAEQESEIEATLIIFRNSKIICEKIILNQSVN